MIEVKAISVPIRDRAVEAAGRIYLAGVWRGFVIGAALVFLLIETFRSVA